MSAQVGRFEPGSGIVEGSLQRTPLKFIFGRCLDITDQLFFVLQGVVASVLTCLKLNLEFFQSLFCSPGIVRNDRYTTH